MEIKKNILEQINKQINEELNSSYLYLSMAAYFDNKNLPGMAQWMKVQAKEELGHAMKFYKYVIERGGKVSLEGLKAPQKEWKGALDAFEEAYKHEMYITEKIHFLLESANKEKDHATASMLKWFIDEQVEEEDSVNNVIQKLKMTKDSNSGLLMLDHQLGKRGEGK